MKAGAVLIVAGVWVLCQILGGNALGRLNITGGGGAAASPAPGPGSGSTSSGANGGGFV